MDKILADYIRSRVLSAGYAYQLQLTVESFGTYLGRPPRAVDLCRDSVNGWLAHLEKLELSPETIRGQRGNLLCLWRDAVDNDPTIQSPHKIRLCPLPERIIDGFSADDAKAILAAADACKGCFRLSKLNRRLYWRAFVLFKWDTALRLGDVLSIERDWIWPGGFVSVVQSKTGKAIKKQLQPQTIAAIGELLAGDSRRLIFPLWGCRESFFAAFRVLVKRAGLKGTSKYLRRGSATAVEILQPGSASKHLGHKSPQLAAKHYLIQRLLPDNSPVPPSLS